MSLSKRQQTTAEEVEWAASRYILEKLGDRLWAGDPAYDERHERWTVPIHSRSLPADVVLEHITLDAYGAVIRAPSRRALQRAVRQQQEPQKGLVAAIQELLSGGPQFAVARGTGDPTQTAPEQPPVSEALAAEELRQLLQNDPDLAAAFGNLRTALGDPQMRPTVLAALEAFARAAQKDERVKE